MQNDLLEELQARGLIAQKSGDDDRLAIHLNAAPRVVYCGFDPTADSLHVGHLVPLLMLKRFQLAGHTPVALMGGATGMIGDPSFKATERSLNQADTVQGWVGQIGAQVSRLLDFNAEANAARMINNADWTAEMDILSFLRDVGKHFSVNGMIAKESVRQRIARPEQGISFTEFSYSLLQSYDFAVLNDRYNCSLQIGGNDQWGNITAGIELTRRMQGAQVYGMTLPLITKSDGTKFGKTESGAVWLDPAKTSPYAFYQFWLQAPDSDVYRYLRYYSFLPLPQIEQIEAEDKASGAKPQAQRILAEQLTLLVHGETALQQAQRISDALFSGDPAMLSEAEFRQLAFDGAPSSLLQGDLTLTDALVQTGLASSRRNARELIAAGAVAINGVPARDEQLRLTGQQACHGRFILLKKGKKAVHLARLAA